MQSCGLHAKKTTPVHVAMETARGQGPFIADLPEQCQQVSSHLGSESPAGGRGGI